MTLEEKQKNPEVLCQELKTRVSSGALRKTEERKEQRRSKCQKKKGKNKAILIGLWVGDIDRPTETFSSIYNRENHEITTVASWV